MNTNDTIWIIGSKATILANSHEYMTEPFIAFRTEREADAACDMVEKVSGIRPMNASASFMFVGTTAVTP